MRPRVVALAVALACAASVALAGGAGAQIVRSFLPRYASNQAGDITIVGNTVMTCPNGGACTTARNGGGGNVNDNDWNMVYVDVDADATTFSSSSATLALPSGGTVLWAGLYWGGYSNNAARGTVRLLTPTAAGYATVTATQVDASGNAYQGFADVTAQVRAAGPGSYRVANVYSTNNTANVHAGWSLVVVYGDPTLPSRNLVVYDGYALVTGTTSVTINVNGFLTPPGGTVSTRVGVVTYEGDLGFTGDSFSLNGTLLSDASNPANNFFNSSISNFGVPVTTKNPNYVNQLGFDIDMVNANGILPNGASSATMVLSTNGDTYYPGVVTFATDLYAPVFDAAGFTKTVTDLNGAPVRPGDVLEYLVTMRNTGQDHATSCTMRDTLPANVAYVPGSLQVVSGPNAGAKSDAAGDDQMEYVAASRTVVARLGTGANAAAGGQIDIGSSTTVRFRVAVTPPAPNGSVVSNQAAFAYTGAQTGLPFTAVSDGDAVAAGVQRTNVTVSSAAIRGTVFEDAGYGGGAGRSLALSAGTGVAGARLELYDATGAFLQAGRSGAGGAYAFDGWPAGTYTVRAVNASVRSQRTGAVVGLLPVQTFRTDGSAGAAAPVSDHVGGENPAIADADSNTTAATLAALATGTATPQSVTPVTLGVADVTGLDFGYNFDVITCTRDAGQGSLRQFLINANALSNAGLAQAGLLAGAETSIFMVPDGAAHPGLRAGLANALTAGVARIVLLSSLPVWSDPGTRLDGTTQTTNVGNTNPAALGSGGSVGADGVALPAVPAPEVELRDGAGLAVGLDLSAPQQAVVGLALVGFGNAPASNSDACVRVGANAALATIDRCVLGATATAWADPGAALRAGGDLVRALGGDGGVLQNSLLGWSGGSALALTSASDGWQVSGCELRSNALADASRGALSIEASGSATASASLVVDGAGNGLDARTSTGTLVLTNLTLRHDGVGGTATTATAGVRLGGPGNRLDRCVVTQSAGAGVQVIATATNNTITRCAVSANSTIGIDLQAAADDVRAGTAPYVTLNDAGDVDAGGNALVNFPVVDNAVLANGSFTLTGWARPGSVIEVFLSDGDPSGFGEGASWITTLTEGSAADLDAGASAYSGSINGVNQGADNTNRFRFTVPAPVGLTTGSRLTATATLAGTGTSEFSGGVVVTTGVTVAGVAYEDANHDFSRSPGETGTGQALWAKLVPAGGTSARQVVSVPAATGAFAFTFVAAGGYQVLIASNSNPADLTPSYPAGWLGTEAAPGVRSGVNVVATDIAGADFGLWHGARIDGAMFRDDGRGGTPNDGLQQPGEAGIAGARVRLTAGACPGGACDSTLTDGAGHFTLWLPFTATGGPATVSAVTVSGWLATGGSAGTSGGAYTRSPESVGFAAIAGTAVTNLGFGEVPANGWVLPGTRSVSPGGLALYSHVFTAGSGGTVRFAASESPVPAIPGWGAQLVLDVNCNGVVDAGEPVLAPGTPVTLLAGQNACVVLRHTAPAAAPAGAREVATLTASFTYVGATPPLASAHELADLTTVSVADGLVITKSVDRATARPGDVLTYTISYANPGARSLSNIVIRDATPAWTVYQSAACATPGAGVTGCSLTQAPAAGAAGPVVWTLAGSLAPGGIGSVSYRVLVQ